MSGVGIFSGLMSGGLLSGGLLSVHLPRYALRLTGEDHPDFQGRLGCTRLVMAPQPLSTNGAKNGTLQKLQSDMDIPGDRRYNGPPPPTLSNDDADDDDDVSAMCVKSERYFTFVLQVIMITCVDRYDK